MVTNRAGVDRRAFLGIAALAALGPAALSPAALFAAPQRSLLLLTPQSVTRIRARIAKSESAAALQKLASHAKNSGPWSVTFARPAHLSLAPNQYFSEGPYFWPNPKNPTGPYIRRDGERNPDRFTRNHDDFSALNKNILALGMSAAFLADRDATERAATILRTWFLDPKTAMAPNLEHGQAIRGVNDGRGTGIIDTATCIQCVQGVALLESAGLAPDVVSGVRQWFTAYLTWLTTSKKGLDESRSGNNHMTWWSAQAAAYALFTGDVATQKAVWTRFRTSLLEEIAQQGNCPREDARTTSLSYSTFNLDAFSELCRLAQIAGLNLWQEKNAAGASVATAAHYIAPYLLHPDTWKKPQITKFKPEALVFPGLAGIGLRSKELLAIHKFTVRKDTALTLLTDLIVQTEAA